MDERGDGRGLGAMVRSERAASCRIAMTLCRGPRTPLSGCRRQRSIGRSRTMPEMYPDIDEARTHHAALKALVERHAGAARNWRALHRALELCGRAAAAVEDRYCREKLRRVEDFAAEMLSGAEQRTEFLKREILNALELFHSRLYTLESLRRAAARSPTSARALRT
jgi:hypothetical protein